MISNNRPSIIKRFPPELVLHLGHHLDIGSSLSSIQTCRQWHALLQPLVWASITGFHWHHPKFPFQQPSRKVLQDRQNMYLYGDSSLASNLKHTRSFEWFDNAYFQWLGLANPRPQLQQPRLVQIIAMASNIRVLSICMRGNLPEQDLYIIIQDLKTLRFLQLHMDYPSYTATVVPVESLFSLGPQLVELVISGGSWDFGALRQLVRQDPIREPWTRMTKFIINGRQAQKHWRGRRVRRLCPNLVD